jgi:hypothetical protein
VSRPFCFLANHGAHIRLRRWVSVRIGEPLATTGKAVLMLLACAMFSCATSAPDARAELVGKWRSTSGGRTAEYKFAADGTFTGTVRAGGAMVANFTGRWSWRGGAIAYEYLGDTTGNIPAGTRDQDKLVTITPGEYVIEAADGSRRTYRRVAE